MLSPESIVYLSLIAQIIVISIVSSSKWVQNQLHIFRVFPPAEYPKFYIFSLNTELVHVTVRSILDLLAIIFTSGIIYFDYVREFGLYTCWALCTSSQLLPSLYSFIMLQISSKLRQKKIKLHFKRFSMVHRSIFDYLSIFYVLLLLVSILLTLNIIVSNEQLITSKKAGLIIIFVITNILLWRQIYKAIYGKTVDKLITDNDKSDKRKQDVQRSFVGIAASVVIFSLLGLNGANTVKEAVWLIIPLSVFIQLSVYHRSKRWHAGNMDVYK